MAMRSGVPIAQILDASDGAQAWEILQRESVDGMITDIHMPHMDGVALVKAMQSLAKPPVTIVLSGYDNFRYAVEMLRGGVKDYILKPVERETLYEALRKMDAEIARLRLAEPEPPHKADEGGQIGGKIRKALEFIHGNYHTGLTMATVSNHVSMGYSHFSNAFKEYTGKNFVAYLQEIRMEQAKRLLRTTDMKVFEIGIKVGYGNEKHFLKMFRSFCGMSPTAYRHGSALRAFAGGASSTQRDPPMT